jgi:hypothetical protein
MAHILMCKAPDAKTLAGASPPTRPQHVMRELIAFLSGGLQAPGERNQKRRIKK